MARNAHPEVTRQRILDAAKKLFAQKGYERTTIQEYSRRARIPQQRRYLSSFQKQRSDAVALVDPSTNDFFPKQTRG